MKQLADDRARGAAALARMYAPVGDQLEQVEESLRKQLRSDYPFVDRLVKHGFRLGGKRLRPALLLLSGQAVGRLGPEHLVLATVVELIHTATLIHDDVLDEAVLRRHLDTVNARWDNETSILLGDYLFSCSLCMAASIGDVYACQAIGETSRVMCEGELRQSENRSNYALAEADYLDIITQKTAALTACCCRLGAHYAGGDAEAVEALARFGRHLGVAFQIADDLLDLLGDEQMAGKSLGTDLAKQKPTLPLIRIFQQLAAPEDAELRRLLSRSGNHHRDALEPWLERYEALAYARQKALDYARRAGQQIAFLPAGPARDALLGLTSFVVHREQ